MHMYGTDEALTIVYLFGLGMSNVMTENACLVK